MPTQEERRDATKTAICAAARRMFAEHGFNGASIEDIATAAGVTKGGVYHHFETKERLFEAVFRAVEDELYEAVVASLPPDASGADLLVEGTRTFMNSCLAPDVHQIVLVDGPRVLGWALFREIDAGHFLPLIVAALSLEAAPGRDVTPIAHLLIGAVDEAVMLLGAESKPATVVGPIMDGLDVVLRAVVSAVAAASR